MLQIMPKTGPMPGDIGVCRDMCMRNIYLYIDVYIYIYIYMHTGLGMRVEGLRSIQESCMTPSTLDLAKSMVL